MCLFVCGWYIWHIRNVSMQIRCLSTWSIELNDAWIECEGERETTTTTKRNYCGNMWLFGVHLQQTGTQLNTIDTLPIQSNSNTNAPHSLQQQQQQKPRYTPAHTRARGAVFLRVQRLKTFGVSLGIFEPIDGIQVHCIEIELTAFASLAAYAWTYYVIVLLYANYKVTSHTNRWRVLNGRVLFFRV